MRNDSHPSPADDAFRKTRRVWNMLSTAITGIGRKHSAWNMFSALPRRIHGVIAETSLVYASQLIGSGTHGPRCRRISATLRSQKLTLRLFLLRFLIMLSTLKLAYVVSWLAAYAKAKIIYAGA